MYDKPDIDLLVLDDDPFMLMLLDNMLNELGYDNVSCQSNGKAALKSITSTSYQPAVILLDINMPEMDGVEFVRSLSEIHYKGAVILISGEDIRMIQATEKLIKMSNIGLIGTIYKPPTKNILAALLKKPAPQQSEAAQAIYKNYDYEAIQQAIIHDQFISYYQPQVAVTTGEVKGVEALLRWRHPEDGLVLPRQFIPAAEEYGLIGMLTNKIIKQSLRQGKVWQKENGLHLNIAVNLSMDDCSDANFYDFVLAETKANQISPASLMLEITESRLIKNPTKVLETLTRLRIKRFRLSIDDFGTGNSTLAQLRDLPFDELKIDYSFTHNAWQDTRLRAIFSANLNLARQLDMQVVVEGIEDIHDWEFVRSAGCDTAQGYFIARPMPESNIPEWIEEWYMRLDQEKLITKV